MSIRLVVGTGNRHKLEEIAPLLQGVPVELLPANLYGKFNPAETGATLEANAIIKAEAAMKMSGLWAIADDTGLEVDALDGAPGIYAARYAGEHCSFEDNIRKLLDNLQGVPEDERAAHFVCVIALCRPGCPPQTFRAACAGRILYAPHGSEGFGYDPVFYVPDADKTFAEMTGEEKNTISHRGRAVRLLRAELLNLLNQGETLER